MVCDLTGEPHLSIETIDVDPCPARLAVVTLNRADDMNPLDWETVRALRESFRYLADEETVRVVAVTGQGKAFSAGGDMKDYLLLQRDPIAFPQYMLDLHLLIQEISQYRKPYIALVNGLAIAGGLELILACDVAFAAASARIGDGHQTYGQMGGGGVLTLLSHYVGPARARELMFTGEVLTALDAAQLGIVSKVVPDDDLIASGVRFAAQVASKSALAIANAKQVTNAGFWSGSSIAQGLRAEREAAVRYCLTSKDAAIGLEAFAAREQPRFLGE
jgi:enoyl-CoA hydratase/carnithine racemase